MLVRCLDVAVISVGVIAIGTGAVSAQNYPNKPIRIIASQPGGDNDFAARIVAQGLGPRLGQQVIVENEEGGSGGAEAVLKAQRDGYTLMNVGSQFWIEPLLHKTPYEPLKDFAPVIALSNVPFFLFVNPSVPADSVNALIALAKAKPGQLKYGSGLPGASGHLATELFKAMAGADLSRVEYKGGAAALNAVVTNEVQLIFASANSGAPLVKAGKLKALAAPNARPSAILPGLPAIQDALPGYETKQMYGILAPAGTPAPVIKRLNEEMAAVLNAEDAKQRFFKAGSEVVAGSSEDFVAFIKSETAKWGKVIKDAGIRAD
jgi:tripartite-type tricarboxylate transporter receptor subunit TctC